MAKGFINTSMEPDMRESGIMTSRLAKAQRFGKMAQNTSGISLTVRKKARASSFGQTGLNMMVNLQGMT